MPLVRGFKAEAERRAAAIWLELGNTITEPLDVTAAAALLGARIVLADELILHTLHVERVRLAIKQRENFLKQ